MAIPDSLRHQIDLFRETGRVTILDRDEYMRPGTTAEDLAKLAQLVDDGALRVDIAATYPLERLADAFAQSREGHTRGKIVVTP